MAIRLRCPKCKKEFRVRDQAAGKKSKCTQCGVVFKIPVPKQRSVASSTQQPQPAPATPLTLGAQDLAGDHEFGGGAAQPITLSTSDLVDPGVDDLFGEVRAPNAQSAPTGAPCRDCGTFAPHGAIICTACGLNFKTGLRLRTKVEPASPTVQREPSDPNVTAARVGLVFVCVGNGAAIFFITLAIGGFETGWIASSVAAVVSMATLGLVWPVFFSDMEDFMESLYYIAKPDILSLMQDEYFEDFWASFKYKLWFGSGMLLGGLTYAGLHSIGL